MAYTGTVATVTDINLMAGENADATGNTEANVNLLIAQAEAYLCCLVRYDIVTNWASLNTVIKKVFTEWASRYCGMALIAYNMSGFTSIVEAEDMINVHVYRMKQIESMLKDVKIQIFIEGA